LGYRIEAILHSLGLQKLRKRTGIGIHISIKADASGLGVLNGLGSRRWRIRAPRLPSWYRRTAGKSAGGIVACESKFPHEPVHADSGVLLEVSLLFSSDEGSLIYIVYQVKAEEDDTANDHGKQGFYKAKPRLALPIDVVITPFSHAEPHR
jgi:hypothetical protein